jgi:hypothetical protein
MKIQIQPVQTWTPAGISSADSFEVRYITYVDGSAVADCHLWAGAREVSSQLITATPEQVQQWTDDLPFYADLARNAGLTPV